MTLFYKEQLGPPRRTLVVAEVGNVHDGSLGNCHAFIDAVADAGADAVKFQCHIALAESTAAEQFPKRFSFHPQDRTRADYWRRMEFQLSEWMGLSSHARERGLEFIVSPFSIPAVAMLANHVDRWKIASGEVSNRGLLHAIKNTKLPVVLSTGMSTTNEINAAVADLQTCEELIVLQCTTEYPTPPEHVGMNLAWQHARNICYWGGLSDHSGTIWPGVVATYLGAAMVEVHVCWSKQQFGVDVSSSLTIEEFGRLCAGVRFAEKMRDNPVEKDSLTASLEDIAAYRDGKRRETVDVYANIARD